MIPGNTPDMHRHSWRLVAALLVGAAACRPDFQLKKFTTNEALYVASLREFQRGKMDNAISGFEKLTTELPARDTLLPRSYWYLANAHLRQDELLLAAQSFNRITESFPEDSLADDAALAAGRAYNKLWRNPSLDAAYGETALATYNMLLGLYPDSKLVDSANADIADLNNRFAMKFYRSGLYYFKRKAYDSGDIYFKDILSKWPETPTARDASLRLVESYKANHYTQDAIEMCAQVKKKYPVARDIAEVCTGVPAPAVVPTEASAAPPSKPPAR
jgi:outer membrane assembly lipoprotein YfiO